MPVLDSIDLDEEDNSSESSTPTIGRTASTIGFGDTLREDEELDLIASRWIKEGPRNRRRGVHRVECRRIHFITC